MLRWLALLLLVATLGCKSTPKTTEEQYAKNLAQQERELAKRQRAAGRKARNAEKEARYREKLQTWNHNDQSSRSSWSEATGGKIEFGTVQEPPRKPNDPRFDDPQW